MSSASSHIRDVLEAYLAGRVNAERLVITVTTAYYGRDGGRGTRDGLGPVIEVIDRASPGIVELGTVPGGVGFEVRLGERPFPNEYEAELRRAAEAVLGVRAGLVRDVEVGAQHAAPLLTTRRGSKLIARVVAAVRRLFSASA